MDYAYTLVARTTTLRLVVKCWGHATLRRVLRRQTPASDLIVVPMSRIILHQPGLGTPDEVLGNGDGTDSGVGEKRLMGIGLAEIGAQKNIVAICSRRLALPN